MDTSIDTNERLHPDLKDIENMFYFFILSHKALSSPQLQQMFKDEDDKAFLNMLKKYNAWVKLETSINFLDGKSQSKLNINESMVFIGKAMTVMMFDILSSNDKVNSTDEFKFLKVIRNAAAHYNKFNFKNENGDWKIGESEVVKWREKTLSREMQGKKAFGEFIYFGEIFLLAKDFSAKL